MPYLENTSASILPINGINLHIVQAGPENGELVILLHGFPEFWYGWRHQIPALAQAGYHVIVPDQRGYNLSDKPKSISAYSIETLAQDILEIMHAYQHKQACLIGHDWGAAVVWHLATQFPQHVHKAITMNVPHPWVMSKTLRRNLRQLKRSWYMFFFQIPWLPEWLLGRSNAAILGNMLKGAGKRSFTDDDIESYRRAWLQKGALTGMLNWYRAAFRTSPSLLTKTPAPQVIVPMLLIWGKQDVALEFSMAGESIALCQTGQLLAIDNASHFVQHDAVEEVNQAVLEFLAN